MQNLNSIKPTGMRKRKFARSTSPLRSPRSHSPLGSLPKVKIVDINQQTVDDLLREVTELRGEQNTQIDALDALEVQHCLELGAMQDKVATLMQVSHMHTANNVFVLTSPLEPPERKDRLPGKSFPSGRLFASSRHPDPTFKNILHWANEVNAILEAKLKQQESVRVKHQERMKKLSTANASLREELGSLKVEHAYIEVKSVSVLQYEILTAKL